MESFRFLISGGGTGGHIFPAISIANQLKIRFPDCEILFVGANGRMEMTRVPEAGYKIVGLDVRGIERKRIWRNFKILIDFWRSYRKAKQIVADFKPNVAIGVGGYVSAAAMKASASHNIPIVIQEQNSYAGLTNRFLAKYANAICVAYPNMEKFFPKYKIELTGNPIRQSLLSKDIDVAEAYSYFGLQQGKKTLLVVGGSLGAKSINDGVMAHIDDLYYSDYQVVWQTGKNYFKSIADAVLASHPDFQMSDNGELRSKNMVICPFIARMEYAYHISDLIVSRAGASSISELSALGKASILVPSPNVAENHQYHNAMALVERGATAMVEDSKTTQSLIDVALKLLGNEERLAILQRNIYSMALLDSASKIVDVIEREIKK